MNGTTLDSRYHNMTDREARAFKDKVWFSMLWRNQRRGESGCWGGFETLTRGKREI